jgi:hypothetical protein
MTTNLLVRLSLCILIALTYLIYSTFLGYLKVGNPPWLNLLSGQAGRGGWIPADFRERRPRALLTKIREIETNNVT